MFNVALDLETFSTREDAVVVAIAAVPFDASGIGAPFYCVVDPKSQPNRHIDAGTVEWWLQQSDAARKELSNERMSASAAAWSFANAFTVPEETLFWGYGAGFDNVILRSFLRDYGYHYAMPFRHDRCLRTAAGLFPEISWEESTDAHNAKYDALAQAKHASKILLHLQRA